MTNSTKFEVRLFVDGESLDCKEAIDVSLMVIRESSNNNLAVKIIAVSESDEEFDVNEVMLPLILPTLIDENGHWHEGILQVKDYFKKYFA